MEILISSMVFTADLVFRMASVMFISLFGVELFMQMGLMRRLKPVGKPISRIARLPAETAVCFLAAIGSMIAAHTMAAQFHADGRLNDRELRLTGILNTVPFHLSGVCQASCRLFFSNEVPSSTAQFSHGLRRAIGGPFSAMRELCYTVPYSNGYTACLSAVFSIFCRLNFFKVTIVPGSQFLVLPDHLSGCFDLAF